MLSILYLRCQAIFATRIPIPVVLAFNSLFEMHKMPEAFAVFDLELTFNSLFEMPTVTPFFTPLRAEALSILYLRCTE